MILWLERPRPLFQDWIYNVQSEVELYRPHGNFTCTKYGRSLVLTRAAVVSWTLTFSALRRSCVPPPSRVSEKEKRVRQLTSHRDDHVSGTTGTHKLYHSSIELRTGCRGYAILTGLQISSSGAARSDAQNFGRQQPTSASRALARAAIGCVSLAFLLLVRSGYIARREWPRT